MPTPRRTAAIKSATAIAAPPMPAIGSARAKTAEGRYKRRRRRRSWHRPNADHAGLGQGLRSHPCRAAPLSPASTTDQQAERSARHPQLPDDRPANFVAEPPRPHRRPDRQRNQVDPKQAAAASDSLRASASRRTTSRFSGPAQIECLNGTETIRAWPARLRRARLSTNSVACAGATLPAPSNTRKSGWLATTVSIDRRP